jgi:hypothetical protein
LEGNVNVALLKYREFVNPLSARISAFATLIIVAEVGFKISTVPVGEVTGNVSDFGANGLTTKGISRKNTAKDRKV